mgnify:CR=1 FL=1
MTDLEISRALALAIGWSEREIYSIGEELQIGYYFDSSGDEVSRRFDYRDWAVAGPIAEKFDCFPYQSSAGTWITTLGAKNAPWPFYAADTPQKAIALAVIGAEK